MDIKDILTPVDFSNLLNEDINNIITTMELEVNDQVDINIYLDEMKEMLFQNPTVRETIEDKVFAGRTAIKWYRLKLNNEEKKKVISKIQSQLFYYNSIRNLEEFNLEVPTEYTCIKIGDNRYLMRILVPTGTRTVRRGLDYEKYTSTKTDTVIIDLEKEYLEIRSDAKNAKKIMQIITNDLGINEPQEIEILGNYGDSLEVFKSSLINGRFTDVTSKPGLNIKLTRRQNEHLVQVFNIIDEYFTTRDEERLVGSLKEIDIETEEVSFMYLLLGGMKKIGMACRPNNDEDLCGLSLYASLKDFIIEHSGFISFSISEDGQKNTIQVGKTTNSISFRSNVSEKVIDYIRNKVI